MPKDPKTKHKKKLKKGYHIQPASNPKKSTHPNHHEQKPPLHYHPTKIPLKKALNHLIFFKSSKQNP